MLSIIRNLKTVSTGLFIASVLLSFSAYGQEGPWRLSEALGLDGGFSLNGTQISRYESLTNNPRLVTSDNDQMFVFRTTLDARYESNSLQAQLELMDARQGGASDDSVINTGIVNSTDILQANVGFKFQTNGNDMEVKVGRFTADWGARRLIARNRYRNTINSFDGVELNAVSNSGYKLRAMYSRPVFRLPSGREDLLDNKHVSDESSEAREFYAVQAGIPDVFDNVSTELTYLGLREKDADGYSTNKRHLDTYSLRFVRSPEDGEFDFESESVFQTGRRIAPATNLETDTLDHEAWYQHLELGYSVIGAYNIRISGLFDYGTGDDDPFDNEFDRFDSMYGVNRPEWGPLGLYDVYTRSNIVSPALRLTMNPAENHGTTLTYRHFWLESAADFWGKTGHRDLTGEIDENSGSHFEVRHRWEAIPGNLRIEVGGVYMTPKNFVEDDTYFGYVATIITF